MSDNRCVCCGENIPEGTQVCPRCMRKYGVSKNEGNKAKRAIRMEDVMNNWVYPLLLAIAVILFIIFVNTSY